MTRNREGDAWKSGSTIIANRIGSDIVAGRFPENSRLPLEASLATTHGVSRNTIREAMRSLAAKRLVEIAPRRGTTVLPKSQWSVLDRDVIAWSGARFRNDPAFMQEFIRARYMVEPAAAHAAAETGSEEQISDIYEALHRMETHIAQTDVEASLETDLAFHLAIAEGANNRFIRSMAHSIMHAMRLNFEVLFTRPAHFSGNMENHRRVAEAIAARDPARAKAAMKQLLNRSRQDTLHMLRPSEEDVK